MSNLKRQKTPFSDPELWKLIAFACAGSDLHEKKALEELRRIAPHFDGDTLELARNITKLFIHQQRAIDYVWNHLEVEDAKQGYICDALRRGDFEAAFDALMIWIQTDGEPAQITSFPTR